MEIWYEIEIMKFFETYDKESVIERYEICWTIYQAEKIVSMHNCIHFVNGKQLGPSWKNLQAVSCCGDQCRHLASDYSMFVIVEEILVAAEVM